MTDELFLRDLTRYNRERYDAFCDGSNFNEIPVFERALNNRVKKVIRIKDDILILSARYKKYIYFCTFTFSDKLLNQCHRTRKRAILDSLYSFDKDIFFIMNPDYGKNTHRLHYHAIIGTNVTGNFRKHLKSNYPCLSSCDRVYFNSKDKLSQVSKYINKLCNHATKDTTRGSRLIKNFSSYSKLDSRKDRLSYRLEDINVLYGTRS